MSEDEDQLAFEFRENLKPVLEESKSEASRSDSRHHHFSPVKPQEGSPEVELEANRPEPIEEEKEPVRESLQKFDEKSS